MDYASLILGFVAGASGSLLLWITVGKRLMLKYAGVSVARAIADPDDEMKVALDGLMIYLWNWLNTPSVEVPGPPSEDGVATKAMVTPMQSVLGTLVDTITARIYAKLTGAKGAAVRDTNRAAAELAGGLGIPLGPRRGQSSGEFLMEQLASRLMPKVEEVINKRLENLSGGGMQ